MTWGYIYLIAAVLALIISASGLALDEHDTTAKFNRAAQEICGINGAWELLPDGFTIQCYTHKGQKQ